jgi:hypothetical protein
MKKHYYKIWQFSCPFQLENKQTNKQTNKKLPCINESHTWSCNRYVVDSPLLKSPPCYCVGYQFSFSKLKSSMFPCGRLRGCLSHLVIGQLFRLGEGTQCTPYAITRVYKMVFCESLAQKGYTWDRYCSI